MKLSFFTVEVGDQIVLPGCLDSSENTDERHKLFEYYFILAIAKLMLWKLTAFR